jgi:thiol-disulfide isomerase/thioredoxin
MLPCLFYFGISVWWEFNETEFHILKHQTFSRPIFVVCYSDSCPNCVGVPELARDFAQNLGNRSDLLVTTVNTKNHDDIKHFRITGTPFFCLVLGPKRKYWPKTMDRSEQQWDEFIREQTSPSLRQIDNATELSDAIQKTFAGGSAFHLEVPSPDDPWIEEMRNLSRLYRIYDASFTYHINSSIKSRLLRVHRSPGCWVDFTDRNMTHFIDDFKFSHFHKYDAEEYEFTIERLRLFIFIVIQALQPEEIDLLTELSSGPACRDTYFGWASTKETKRKILSKNGLNLADVPIGVYRDPEIPGCIQSYKGGAHGVRSFLDEAQHGIWCNRTMKSSSNGTVGGVMTFASDVEPVVNVKEGLLGIKFVVGYFVFSAVPILLIRMFGKQTGEKNVLD